MSDRFIQSLAIAVIALTFAALVINLSRRNLLSFRYTMGWLVLLAIGAVSSLLTPLVRPVADLLGTTEGGEPACTFRAPDGYSWMCIGV